MSEKIYISEELDEVEKGSPFDFKELFMFFFRQKHWFIISILIALSIAFINIFTTPPIYKRSTSVLIKNEEQTKSSALGDISSFSEISLLSSNGNVQNEIGILKSPALMQDVVKRLLLNEKYTLKDNCFDKDLYGKSPIKINFYNKGLYEEGGFAFKVKLLPNKSVEVYDIKQGQDIEFDRNVIKGGLNKPLDTPLGPIQIDATDKYSASYHNEVINVSVSPIQNIASGFGSNLSIQLDDKSSTIITLSLTDISTKRAEDILNVLIEVYNEAWIADKNKIANSLSGFIDQRLEKIDSELGSVDDDISGFKSKNLLPDVDAVSKLYMQQASDNRNQILALENQLSIAKYILNYLNNSKQPNQMLPINTGISALNIETQISEFNNSLLKRNSLIENSGESNPIIKDVDNSLASMRQSIIHSLESLISSIATNVNNIKQSESQANSKIASNPTQAKYLMTVERQQKVKESLYIYLLQKKEENELSKAFTAYNIRIINPPSGNFVPVNMAKSKILLIAFLIGLIFPAIVLFIIKRFDTSIKSKDDLQQLSAAFIGSIPEVDEEKKQNFLSRIFQIRKKEESNEVVKNLVEENKTDPINEVFRMLRTNFDFMYEKAAESKVVLLTSAIPNSGKTFVSLNLAKSLAIKRKCVLLIDMDMRKGTLSTVVNSPKIGLSNYLAKQTDKLSDILIKEGLHSNLDIIPLGTFPPNPTELLESKQLADFLDDLKKTYDYIFIDSTPTYVADASILAKVADISLFIIRANITDKKLIPEIESIYKSGVYKNMSLILNGVTMEKTADYGYGY